MSRTWVLLGGQASGPVQLRPSGTARPWGSSGVGGWAGILRARTAGILAKGLCRHGGEREEGEGRRPYSGGSGTYGTSFLAQEGS